MTIVISRRSHIEWKEINECEKAKPRWIEILELSDKDFKTPIINMNMLETDKKKYEISVKKQKI